MRTILRAGLKAASGIGLARQEGSLPGFNRQALRHQSVADVFSVEVQNRDSKTLDVGCGEGSLAAILRSKGFTSLAGCDWLPHEKVTRAPDGFAFRQIDLNGEGLTAYDPTSFDAIICSDVLEHLENPAAALREFARVLVPGGKAIVSLPNAFNLLERVSWFATGNSTRYKRETSTNEFGHISVLPRDVMYSLAARAELDIVGTSGGYAYLDGYVVMPRRAFSTAMSYNIVWTLRKPA